MSITVRRGEKLLDFTLIRSRIEGFDLVMNDDLLEVFRKFFTENTPDYKAEIKVILEDGDKVAILSDIVRHESGVSRLSGLAGMHDQAPGEWQDRRNLGC